VTPHEVKAASLARKAARARKVAPGLVRRARARGRVETRGGALGWCVGRCSCPLEWYAYADDEIAGVAYGFAWHLQGDAHAAHLRLVRS